MGMIRIELSGSFPRASKNFSAQKYGHASAVADAISWLSGPVLQAATRQDHDLQAQGASPDVAFGQLLDDLKPSTFSDARVADLLRDIAEKLPTGTRSHDGILRPGLDKAAELLRHYAETGELELPYQYGA